MGTAVATGFPDDLPLHRYRVYVYNRCVHPGALPLKQRRVIKHGAYELEAWLLPGGHAFRFDLGAFSVTELLTDEPLAAPLQGMVSDFLVAGERDVEHRFSRERVTYLTSVQTECLTDSLFSGCREEMREHARLNRSLSHSWEDDAGDCLSLVDVQQMAKQVHVQSYHLLAAASLVVRTQTIFEHA